jgi:hypothetical protein
MDHNSIVLINYFTRKTKIFSYFTTLIIIADEFHSCQLFAHCHMHICVLSSRHLLQCLPFMYAFHILFHLMIHHQKWRTQFKNIIIWTWDNVNIILKLVEKKFNLRHRGEKCLFSLITMNNELVFIRSHIKQKKITSTDKK